MRAFLLYATLLSGCAPEQAPQEKAVAAAYEYAKGEPYFYRFDIEKLPPEVEDLGDSWLIQFDIPEGMAGGAPEVVVRKSDLQIVAAVSGQ